MNHPKHHGIEHLVSLLLAVKPHLDQAPLWIRNMGTTADMERGWSSLHLTTSIPGYLPACCHRHALLSPGPDGSPSKREQRVHSIFTPHSLVTDILQPLRGASSHPSSVLICRYLPYVHIPPEALLIDPSQYLEVSEHITKKVDTVLSIVLTQKQQGPTAQRQSHVTARQLTLRECPWQNAWALLLTNTTHRKISFFLSNKT